MNFIEKYRKKISYNQKNNCDEKALSYMNYCESILDIGCGEGRFIANDPKRIIGIDHNQKSLKICEEKDYSVVYGSVTKLPFESNSFDAVHCSHVIEHLLPNDAHALLCEMNRVLKIGGIFCIRTPLMYNDFYNDLTHIKPYNPEAILHYINVTKSTQRTLEDIQGNYDEIVLLYRRQQLFSYLAQTRLWIIGSIFNVLYRFGVSGFKKTGYMLILQKNK